MEGREEAAERFARILPVDVLQYRDRDGKSAIHHAATRLYVDVVRILLGRLPELSRHWTSALGKPAHWTALHCVADLPFSGRREDVEKSTEIAGRLLEAAPYTIVNGQTNRGATALMLAAARGNRPLVELLLDDGRRDVNIRDFGSPQKTVMDRVSRSGAEIAQLIYERRRGQFAGWWC